MNLELWRYSSDQNSTLGFLMLREEITRRKLCYTVEDAYHVPKVPEKTRIPAGRYRILLRVDSPMARRYAAQFPEHRGMLWLQDVPGFRFIYLHIGNDEDDTEGCILVGTHVNEDARAVQQSRNAYREIYSRLVGAADDGSEDLWITILDLDRPVLPTIQV